MATAKETIKFTETPLQRIERIKDVIAKGGKESQELRHLPQDCVDILIDEGMFRFAMPEELGGENATTIETIEILEAVTAIATSGGWDGEVGSEN